MLCGGGQLEMVRDEAAHLPTYYMYTPTYIYLLTFCIYFHINSTIAIWGFSTGVQ